jgi:hypothetical protein
MKSFEINSYFFTERPHEPEKTGLYIIAFLLFAVALVVGIGIFIGFFSYPLIPFGIVAIFAGFYFLKQWKKPYLEALERYNNRPSEEQMDSWLLEDFRDIVKVRAFERFEIDKAKVDSERFLILPTPLYWNIPGYFGQVKRKMGNDGAYRYTSWSVDVLILTKNYISVFTCVFDWLSGSVTHEETNEFFYNDVASIKTGYEDFDKNFIDNEEMKIGEIYKLKIVNVSGDVMVLFSDIPKLSAPRVSRINIENVVTRLRKMLRNRRIEEDPDSEIVFDNQDGTDNLAEGENSEENNLENI